LAEIKQGSEASGVGMYLIHNGVVRGTARDGSVVTGMELTYNRVHLQEVIEDVKAMPGVVAVRAWINEGDLSVGDDIMLALVAGDIRENVFGGLQQLVRLIKTEVVKEIESR
jgi:molybdopterin synthase catalytic subunit